MTREIKYTKKELILLLKNWAKKHGKSPIKKEWLSDPNLPSEMPFRRIFGSWSKAIFAAGLTPRYKSSEISLMVNPSEEIWYKRFQGINNRCNDPKIPNYGAKGIKNLLTVEQIKELWFRDKAYLMKRPSIDRIDSNDHYRFDNCRFMEVSENSRLATVPIMRPVAQYSLDGKFIRNYLCLSDACKAIGKYKNAKSPSWISDCLAGRKLSAYGFKWMLINATT